MGQQDDQRKHDGWGHPKPTKPARTPRPKPSRQPRPTKAPKSPRTPRPKPEKTPRPTKAPRTKAPKPVKTPSPTFGGQYGPGDEGNDKNTQMPKMKNENAEMDAFEINSDQIVEDFKPATIGYRAYVEIAGLLSVAIVLIICFHSLCCQKRKGDDYEEIKDATRVAVI